MFANINHKYFWYANILNNIYQNLYMYVKNTYLRNTRFYNNSHLAWITIEIIQKYEILLSTSKVKIKLAYGAKSSPA